MSHVYLQREDTLWKIVLVLHGIYLASAGVALVAQALGAAPAAPVIPYLVAGGAGAAITSLIWFWRWRTALHNVAVLKGILRQTCAELDAGAARAVEADQVEASALMEGSLRRIERMMQWGA